jgi:hypothetical protein
LILRRGAEIAANAIVLGPETRHGPLGARISAEVVARAPTHVIVLQPAAGPLGRPDGQPPALPPHELWHAATR